MPAVALRTNRKVWWVFVPSLDPTDVYPPSNLPGRAVPWGRTIEGDVGLLKKARMSLSQSLKALNRLLAASLQTLGDQITTLSDQQATLSDQQATLTNTVSDLDATQVALTASQTRINQTNQVFSQNLALNSDYDGSYPGPSITPPAWATAAIVSTSMVVVSGSTSRVVILPTYAYSDVLDVPGPNMTSNFYATNSDVSRYETAGSVVVPNVDTAGLGVITYRTVMEIGSGTLNVGLYISVTWLV